MIDKEAIDALSKADAIRAAESAMAGAFNSDAATALPNDFQIHDLEKFMPARRRMRGKMHTTSLQSFGDYVVARADLGATVFVKPIEMKAAAVLNMGNMLTPGHCDHVAVLAFQATAAYVAMRNLVKYGEITQRKLAEFMEDHYESIQCLDVDGNYMVTKHAIAAVRNITIEALAKADASQGQLSAERSSFESVKASSKAGAMPVWIEFRCVPYMDLPERVFRMRLGIAAGEKAPRITLVIQKAEQHTEEMGQEACAVVAKAIKGDTLSNDIPVLIGEFAS
jgi:uncharacterized protein YfdQ (DUF2303 family)